MPVGEPSAQTAPGTSTHTHWSASASMGTPSPPQVVAPPPPFGADPPAPPAEDDEAWSALPPPPSSSPCARSRAGAAHATSTAPVPSIVRSRIRSSSPRLEQDGGAARAGLLTWYYFVFHVM